MSTSTKTFKFTLIAVPILIFNVEASVPSSNVLGTNVPVSKSTSELKIESGNNQIVNFNIYEKYKDVIQSFKNIDGEMMKFLSDIPNQNSIDISLKILNELSKNNIRIANLSPSPDGGIMFEFVNNNVYQSIEVFNDDDIIYLKNNNGEISSDDLDLKDINHLISTEFSAPNL